MFIATAARVANVSNLSFFPKDLNTYMQPVLQKSHSTNSEPIKFREHSVLLFSHEIGLITKKAKFKADRSEAGGQTDTHAHKDMT